MHSVSVRQACRDRFGSGRAWNHQTKIQEVPPIHQAVQEDLPPHAQHGRLLCVQAEKIRRWCQISRIHLKRPRRRKGEIRAKIKKRRSKMLKRRKRGTRERRRSMTLKQRKRLKESKSVRIRRLEFM